MQTISMTINSLMKKMAISITLCKVQTFLKGHKNLKHLPLYLTFTKKTANQVEDCFKFCGLLRKAKL